MIKILHIINSLGQGGVERLLLDICTDAVKTKHIIISLKDDDFLKDSFNKINVPVFNVRGNNILKIFNFLKVIKKINKLHDYDLIQGWMYLGSIFAFIAGISVPNKKIAFAIHNGDVSFRSMSFISWICCHLSGLLSSCFGVKTIFCASTSKSLHKKFFFNEKNSLVIYNGVSLNRFNSSRKKINPDIGAVVKIGLVARNHAVKDIQGAFEVLAKLHRACEGRFILHLFGSGLDGKSPEHINIIDRLGINNFVIFHGRIEAVEVIYEFIDILLITSLAEALPNVLLEALACEVPVVSTSVGDIPFFLDGISLPIQPKNYDGLSEQVIKVADRLASPEGRIILLAKCSNIVRNYTSESMFENYYYFWKSLILKYESNNK